MIRKMTVLLWVPLAWVAFSGIFSYAEELPHPAEWVPSEALIVLEVSSAEPLVEALLARETHQRAKEIPQIAEFLRSSQFAQMAAVVSYLELRLDTPWREAVRHLLGGRIWVAVFPQNGILLFIDTKNPVLLERLHQVVLEHAREEARKAFDPARVASRTYKGMTAWTVDGGQNVYALVGPRLILTNKAELMKSVADLREEGGTHSLARSENYQAARTTLGVGMPAWVFVNLSALAGRPRAERIPEVVRSNPLLGLLLADTMEAVKDSSWLAGAVQIVKDRLSIKLQVDGSLPAADQPLAFSLPDENTGVLPNIEVPRRLVALTLYRDLAKFYAAKDILFPERTSGLIFFENMMGIFFTGRHFSEEVLPHLHPEIRLVVAAQDYRADYGIPDVQVPAVAVVFRMKDPAQFTLMAEEAWQKALGLINFTRGQQALPGLILDRQEYQGVRYSVAAFPTVGLSAEERKHVRFNFKPVLAACGEHLILSSTEQLARDVIDYLRKEEATSPPRLAGCSLMLETSREGLLRLIEANHENLVLQNMVEKGHDRGKAEEEVRNLWLLVSLLGEMKLEWGRTKNQPWVKAQWISPF